METVSRVSSDHKSVTAVESKLLRLQSEIWTFTRAADNTFETRRSSGLLVSETLAAQSIWKQIEEFSELLS